MARELRPELDRWKHRVQSYAGDREMGENLLGTHGGFVIVEITADEMDALSATPKELIPAPGTGKVVVVQDAFAFVDAGGTQFSSVAIEIRYTNGSGDKVTADIAAGTVASATDAYYHAVGASVAGVANAAVVAKAASDISAGNGTLWLKVRYIVEDLTHYV